MNIKVVKEQITIDELKEIAKEFYGNMIKGVVDVDREVIAVGGEYHIDASNALVENGSKPQNIWGFNWYFDQPSEKQIEYVALINIRPAQGNRVMEVQDASLRNKMKSIILKYLP